MKKEIQEIIEKNLPAQVGDVLKKRLEHLETVEGQYNNLRNDYNTVKNINTELHSRILELEAKIETQDSLTVREKSLEQDQNSLDLTLSNMERDCSNNKVDMMYVILGQVFASPVYRKTHTRGKTFVNQYDNATGEYKDVVDSETETTETREE